MNSGLKDHVNPTCITGHSPVNSTSWVLNTVSLCGINLVILSLCQQGMDTQREIGMEAWAHSVVLNATSISISYKESISNVGHTMYCNDVSHILKHRFYVPGDFYWTVIAHNTWVEIQHQDSYIKFSKESKVQPWREHSCQQEHWCLKLVYLTLALI